MGPSEGRLRLLRGRGDVASGIVVPRQEAGRKIYAEIVGYGASCDAYHVTKPSPNGEGACRAMRMALEDANLNPSDIEYINAHGTSTPAGDIEETRAVIAMFGSQALSKELWVSSTKSVTGHLLGGAGAVEAAFCGLAIRDSVRAPDRQPRGPGPRVPPRLRPGLGPRASPENT